MTPLRANAPRPPDEAHPRYVVLQRLSVINRLGEQTHDRLLQDMDQPEGKLLAFAALMDTLLLDLRLLLSPELEGFARTAVEASPGGRETGETDVQKAARLLAGVWLSGSGEAVDPALWRRHGEDAVLACVRVARQATCLRERREGGPGERGPRSPGVAPKR
ncbi:hypothetical protein [Streptomyces sp. NPDC058872]|uniref:hypothetical protein n=1 Tax=Streptomyces sp. NPDC058872 TaxID=3346661 RepID=UPI003680FE40